MENKTALPLLTTDEMMALLATSTLVFTSVQGQEPETEGQSKN